ncbi:MAG TPA: hypothetical protein VKK79_23875 [Candidatus Lokiarchaeia archaeon]|nr:hypothetical protein [Candidatus Lokiarchaeia archaeon]
MSDPNFDSISPSAKSLLLTKALTTIPFAKEAARLIWGENSLQYGQKRLSSKGFFLRLVHFESRYWSIDAALSEIGLKNILEFSSGFSFRGLSMCQDPEVYYVDTDLPQIMEVKKILVQELGARFCDYPVDHLFLRELNVLDEDAFTEMVNLLPAACPVAIINEGLLVYLDEGQKRQLCAIIHDLLSERGGYWITADIYLKKEKQDAIAKGFYDEKGTQFLEEHNVEENKFESFESAETFFKDCGFEIYMKIEPPAEQISSRKLIEKNPGINLGDIKGRKKTRETWILKIAE